MEFLLGEVILMNAIWRIINAHFREANFNLAIEVVKHVCFFLKFRCLFDFWKAETYP